MPRVIHVLRKFEPAQWGGIETQLVALIPEMARLGWTSEVHVPAEPGSDVAPLLAAGARVRTFRARYPSIGLTPRARAELVTAGGNLVSVDELAALTFLRRADLLHVHTLRRLGGVVRVASRLTGTPYAFTLHSPVRAEAAVLERESRRRTRGMIDLGAPFGWAVGARRVVDDADVVFALNALEHAAWQDARRGRHLQRVANGVDPTRATLAAQHEARRALPALGDAPYVLVLGRIDPAKGQDVALAAFARAAPPAVHLVLAGSVANGGYADALRAQARDIAARVHFAGNVGPAMARALLAGSTVAMIPSRTEAFGIVLLEAWAEGACALVSDVGGLGDIARESGAVAGLVRAGAVEPWADALGHSLADDALRARERREAPGRVRARYSWRRLAEQTVAAYEQAIARRRAA